MDQIFYHSWYLHQGDLLFTTPESDVLQDRRDFIGYSRRLPWLEHLFTTTCWVAFDDIFVAPDAHRIADDAQSRWFVEWQGPGIVAASSGYMKLREVHFQDADGVMRRHPKLVLYAHSLNGPDSDFMLSRYLSDFCYSSYVGDMQAVGTPIQRVGLVRPPLLLEDLTAKEEMLRNVNDSGHGATLGDLFRDLFVKS